MKKNNLKYAYLIQVLSLVIAISIACFSFVGCNDEENYPDEQFAKPFYGHWEIIHRFYFSPNTITEQDYNNEAFCIFNRNHKMIVNTSPQVDDPFHLILHQCKYNYYIFEVQSANRIRIQDGPSSRVLYINYKFKTNDT